MAVAALVLVDIGVRAAQPCLGPDPCTLAATFAGGQKLTGKLASKSELQWNGGTVVWSRSTASASCLGNWTDSGGNHVSISANAIIGPHNGWYPAAVTDYSPGQPAPPAPPISPPPPAPAGSARPCDIYAAAGTPCVAAHSVTRAMYGAYAGALYAVQRRSDNTTKTISAQAAGGPANAADQDSFCAGTACVIKTIYDQSGRHNHLHTAPPGGNHEAPDAGVNASASPLKMGGHSVYAAYFDRGMGYRQDCTSGVATGDEPETIYMVTNSKHFNSGCWYTIH
eukprot:COSAG05_NODE_5136_length_1255_cov_2.293253_1_plen_282_part_00